jgi:hypothetical protein
MDEFFKELWRGSPTFFKLWFVFCLIAGLAFTSGGLYLLYLLIKHLS